MAGDHDGDVALAASVVFVGYPGQAVLVVGGGGLVARVDGVLVADGLGPLSLLFHIGAADQLRPEVPSLPAGQLHVTFHRGQRVLQIGLVRIEHISPVLVVSENGWEYSKTNGKVIGN